MGDSESTTAPTLETIVSLTKRRGFIYPSADIYGGLNGVYDIGPLGVALKNNIRKAWTRAVQSVPEEVLFVEGALLAPRAVWEASGHLSNFQDPMVDCTACKHRFRADDIDVSKNCPVCGKKAWTDIRQFNLMFKTFVGAAEDAASEAYLRPETAQSIFVNFKNIISSNRVKIPFGVAQIGKSFRNEITPKQFLFRMREFEQMELEWFVKPGTGEKWFEYWCEQRKQFYQNIGLDMNKIRMRAHEKGELAHYSQATTDVEYQFPFGWKELEGIAWRGAFDLAQHTSHSGKDLAVYDETDKSSYVPEVIECSLGTDRLLLTLLFDAYREETVKGDTRVVLAIKPELAPYQAAFLPLSKAVSKQMRAIWAEYKKKGLAVTFDETGSIGKRYRRQDEIGTPLCFTYDFESIDDRYVTVRDRDTMEQRRISIDAIDNELKRITTPCF